MRSFLGTVNFYATVIPDLATVSEPLSRLTSKDVHCTVSVGNKQRKAFNALKKRLANTETLGEFDKDAETCLIIDACPVGLGAVLTQVQNGEERVICYANGSLTDLERRYS